ncbi:MAG: tetratricopeptide repeat protein [Deltaproteobacteria bacterium]|nr:tetratricopeptide repeat protein [Deltaproteobacteria bacterium]
MQDESLTTPPGEVSRAIRRRPGKDLLGFTLKASLTALTIFLVFLIYSSSLDGPFLFDDGSNIKNNSAIRLTRLSWSGLKDAATNSPLSNRPLAYISFALNYYFHSYRTVGYHTVNISIHMFTGLFLFLFLKTTLDLPLMRSRYGNRRWLPYIATLIWLVHPLQTQSVAYIVQRMNSMAAMFYILSMLSYVRARLEQSPAIKWSLAAVCLISGLMSLGTKQIAATLPVFILLYEWYFFQDLNAKWLKRRLPVLFGLAILCLGVSLIYLDGHPLEKILSRYEVRNFTLLQRVLTEFRVVILYLSLLLYPHPNRLNLDYDFPLSHSLIEPVTTLLALTAIVGLLGWSVRLAKKDRLISFCILWYFGNLVIESSIIGLEIVFEHRTYLPSMMIILMAATLVDRYLRSTFLKVAIICAITLVFSAWTYERNAIWSNAVALWSDTVKKSPQKVRPHNNLGNALKRQGKIEEAIEHFNRALQINPGYAKAHNNLGTALAKQGKTDEAIKHFGFALYIDPNYAAAHSNIGVALASRDEFEKAIVHFKTALRLKPDYAKVHSNLGAALVHQGKLHEALAHFQTALRIKPDDIQTYKNLQLCLKLIKQNKN